MKRNLVLVIKSDAEIFHLVSMILEDCRFNVIGSLIRSFKKATEDK